ncbi:MAG: type II toxin-antitoxin system VapC family toxin [Parvularculaceae bacterium]|nr:type II toxin-antitoxin system VapC family toxin [Parvularculaceae bacterium]
MILVDVNILVYASLRSFDQHDACRDWLNERLSGDDIVGLPWHSLIGFLRIATHARITQRPLSMQQAWEQATSWLKLPNVRVPGPTERHAQTLAAILAQNDVGGNLVSDAHLAALAIEHGLTLCSTDGDFARFKSLRWLNPLAPAWR